MNRRSVQRSEAQLAYFAAAKALRLDGVLDLEKLGELADHTRTVEDLSRAIEAMREAVEATNERSAVLISTHVLKALRRP